MKKLFALMLVLSPFIGFSQHTEVGIMVGASAYEGDLSHSSIAKKLQETRPAFGAFARYNINNYVAARLTFNYGTLTSSDANSKLENRNRRNLSFRSNIFEFGLTGEFNILGYQPYNLEKIFSPYVFAGIAVFKYNPKAELNDEWIELQPLGTEGQGLAEFPEREIYNLTQFAIPFGGGLKYALNDSWNIGLEAGLRMTFTDYIDDVSTTYVGEGLLLESRGELAAALSNRSGAPIEAGESRGKADVNDWYIFGGITVSYNFMDNGLVGFRRKSGKNTGCPTF